MVTGKTTLELVVVLTVFGSAKKKRVKSPVAFPMPIEAVYKIDLDKPKKVAALKASAKRWARNPRKRARAKSADQAKQRKQKKTEPQPLLPTDLGRGIKGRKCIERLFMKLVQVDWFVYASNPMFEKDTDAQMCRVPQLWSSSLIEIARRVPSYFSVRYADLRSPEQYSHRVWQDISEAIAEIERDNPSRSKFKNILKGVHEATNSALLA